MLKVKENSNISDERVKARLVAQGYKQRYQIDYDKTFSSMVKTANHSGDAHSYYLLSMVDLATQRHESFSPQSTA